MKGVIMRVLLQIILAAHFMAAYSNATVYYVDAQGDDSNPGSTSAPFRTLMRGAGAAGPGDTVLVRDGIYGHENAITGGDDPNALQASPVVLKNSGTPDAWIIIRAEHKWGATLDCEMQCDAYFDLKNASYIQIQDFVITGATRKVSTATTRRTISSCEATESNSSPIAPRPRAWVWMACTRIRTATISSLTGTCSTISAGPT
jgi:uncharacterized protein DUF1565